MAESTKYVLTKDGAVVSEFTGGGAEVNGLNAAKSLIGTINYMDALGTPGGVSVKLTKVVTVETTPVDFKVGA